MLAVADWDGYWIGWSVIQRVKG